MPLLYAADLSQPERLTLNAVEAAAELVSEPS